VQVVLCSYVCLDSKRYLFDTNLSRLRCILLLCTRSSSSPASDKNILDVKYDPTGALRYTSYCEVSMRNAAFTLASKRYPSCTDTVTKGVGGIVFSRSGVIAEKFGDLC